MNPLAPLRVPADLPPSKVNLDRALRDGRRRQRNRRVLAVATAAIAVGATLIGVSAFALERPSSPPADDPLPTGCSVHRLPAPGPGTAVGVDPAGGYAIGGLDDKPQDGVLLWAAGVLQVLEGAPLNAYPAAVNASGVVVGNGGEATSIPWMLKDHTYTRLALPPDAKSVTVSDINASGDIIGTAAWDAKSRIVRWNAARPGEFTYVTTTPAVARAASIADDGTILGDAGDAGAYVWRPDGTGEALKLPDGRPAGGATQLAGDWAIGWYDDGAWTNHGVRWNIQTGAATLLDTFIPAAIDATGAMVGVVRNDDDHEYSPPAAWRDGKVLDLPVLEAGQSATVMSMTADGHMAVGWLFRAKNDPITPVRWSCP
ncbi:hypothetical protein ACQP00_02445 [Dactylosporangium sp. CS-047395]|uniref:hypothetical protein n=1 Tax=Dactylosporangium sp. CS-047395 TaxID=3239936 RepID=UPI003D8CF6BE